MNERARELFKWNENPFSFRILPEYFVGYEKETDTFTDGLNNGSKFSILLGPTGSGKTTFMKYLVKRFPGSDVIYLPKPPKSADDWVTIFNPILKPSRFSFLRKDVNIYNLYEHLNKKLNGRKCLLFIDECHEASLDSLEWIRTITDQTDNLFIILAGLPVFEKTMMEKLETFMRRVNIHVNLTNLSKAETRELIKRRIEGIGGDDIRPFTVNAVDYIYDNTGGFPREVLKLCDDMVQRAMEKGVSTVEPDIMKGAEEPEKKLSMDTVEELPERQKLIVDTLAEGGEMTPSEIAKSIKTEEYKNKDNAVRSVNNLLRRLMQDGLVDRKKVGKTYKYSVSSRFNSVLVTA